MSFTNRSKNSSQSLIDSRLYLRLGKVGRAVGLKGEFTLVDRLVFVVPGSAKILDLPSPTILFLGDTIEQSLKCSLINQRFQNEKIILKCRELDDRNKIESQLGKNIWIERKLLTLDEHTEYFWADLIGKHVIDQNGNFLGQIVGVNNFGASDVVEVHNESGKSVTLPLIDQYFDMSFTSHSSELKLTIDASEISDLWN